MITHRDELFQILAKPALTTDLAKQFKPLLQATLSEIETITDQAFDAKCTLAENIYTRLNNPDAITTKDDLDIMSKEVEEQVQKLHDLASELMRMNNKLHLDFTVYKVHRASAIAQRDASHELAVDAIAGKTETPVWTDPKA